MVSLIRTNCCQVVFVLAKSYFRSFRIQPINFAVDQQTLHFVAFVQGSMVYRLLTLCLKLLKLAAKNCMKIFMLTTPTYLNY